MQLGATARDKPSVPKLREKPKAESHESYRQINFQMVEVQNYD